MPLILLEDTRRGSPSGRNPPIGSQTTFVYMVGARVLFVVNGGKHVLVKFDIMIDIS